MAWYRFLPALVLVGALVTPAAATTLTVDSTAGSTPTTAAPTTTTTLVSTCVEPGEPRFPSIRCRLVVLRSATAASTALGDLRSNLDRPLGKAVDDTGAAQSFCASHDTKHARRRLKQTLRQLVQYSHRLRALKARKTAPEAVREPFASEADTIRGDATTLRHDLACPTDAT
jgi:hypothetical protein